MKIYDKANELAKMIKSSGEFIEYKNLKDIVYSDEKDKGLIKEYKNMQLKAQSCYMTGENPDPMIMDRLQKLGEVLQFNEDISKFLIAEYNFNTLIGDVYKIIGEACEIDLDMFKE